MKKRLALFLSSIVVTACLMLMLVAPAFATSTVSPGTSSPQATSGTSSGGTTSSGGSKTGAPLIAIGAAGTVLAGVGALIRRKARR